MEKEALDNEILREIASVGGGYGEKLEKLILELERILISFAYINKRIRRSGSIPLLSMRLALSLRKRFNRIKDEAFSVRKNLIIYREALGLTSHREVFEIYPIEKFKLGQENSSKCQVHDRTEPTRGETGPRKEDNSHAESP